MRKIEIYEPWFFLVFGVFHLHRIWGLVDRKSYADYRVKNKVSDYDEARQSGRL